MDIHSLAAQLGDTAGIYLPDTNQGHSTKSLQGVEFTDILRRVKITAVGAHPDDIELGMAAVSLSAKPNTFVGITCTSGAGSARGPSTKDLTDEELVTTRRVEQRRAAELGHYAAIIQLGHKSSVVKSKANRQVLVTQLTELFKATNTELIVTHNPAAKHATHVGVALAVIEAVKNLDPTNRPHRVLGAELWRGLDWLALNNTQQPSSNKNKKHSKNTCMKEGNPN